MTSVARAPGAIPDGEILVVGGGGFAAEAMWVIDAMRAAGLATWHPLGYADDNPSKRGVALHEHRVLGTPEQVAEQAGGRPIRYFCAIGNNAQREAVAARLDRLGWQAATLIHPSATIAPHVTVGEGSYVGAGTILCPNAVIGRHVVLNVRVVVGHDARLLDFCQASPGATINGACEIGTRATVGANASIHPMRKVGADAVVGANSQVVRSVPGGCTVSGVPATMTFRRR